jgi:meiosis-specific protein HOP1
MPKDLNTFDQSLLYTKKLIIIAVSSVAYLRGLFPQNAFTEREFEGMKLQILQSNSSSFKDAEVLTEWLKGKCEKKIISLI